MIGFLRRKWWVRLSFLGVLGFVALVVALHGMSFSMNREEVAAYFQARDLAFRVSQYRVGDRTLHAVEVGDPNAPPVVFVHGSPGSWDAFISYLSDGELLRRARLIAVDRPGFGDSGRGRPQRSLQQQAADLKPFLEHNPSGKPAVLVGHSFGGPVIARMAMDYPDLVGGLVFLAASVDPELEKTKWYQIPADWAVFSWLVPVDLKTTNREILALKAELEEMLPLWERINMPVTVIQGEDDTLVPAGNADFIEKHLKRSAPKMIRLEQQGHFIPWERFVLVRDELVAMLDEAAGEREKALMP